MLDFFFIRDEQSRNSDQISPAGGIDYEEFEKAQDLKILESHLNYYSDFRWSSQSVKQKRVALTPAITAAIPNLSSILKQAFGAELGLVAFGD